MSTKNTLRIFLFVIVSILVLSCSNSKEEKAETKLGYSKIPPGHAKIVGTIIEIEPVDYDSGTEEDPCSKAPCVAVVKINSAAYGATFPPFSKGEKVKIKFRFTLEKTSEDLFPNMEETYPGLKVGEDFAALVAHVLNADETKPKFQIYSYEKL